MNSKKQRPVQAVSKGELLSSDAASHWNRAAKAIGLAAACAVSAALTGCGASPSHQADVQAQTASTRASMLLAAAGRYHPKSHFPVSISAPLNSGQLMAAKDAAKGNPGAYIQPPSVARDLRHAYATLSTALNNSDLNFHFKGLLEMQRGLVNLAAAQVHTDQLSDLLIALQQQVLSVDGSAAEVGHYAGKMVFLQKQHDLYLHLYDQDLAHARRMEKTAARNVAQSRKHVEAVARVLAHYRGITKALNVRGMALQTEGEVNVTPTTLADFKRGAGFLNRAAAANQRATVLEAHYQLAELAMHAAELQQVRWANQVAALRQAQKSAAELAHSDSAQVAALKAGVTVLIDGTGGSSPTSVAGRAATINALIKTIDKQAASAQKLTDQAATNLSSALNEQRRSSAYAQTLITAGMKPGDPLVVANQNRAPECILEVYRAAAALKAGQIAAMRMYAAQLQASAAKADTQIFAIISESSPLQAPDSDAVAHFRKQAMVEFNLHAAGALKQAQASYPNGSSSLQWIVPAMQYNVDISVAGISNNSSVRTAAIKAAAASASQAQKVNATLNFPLPKP